jgi:tRNA (adenine57-N1/adenine58-N1)-methyltransferase catalytic subunit
VKLTQKLKRGHSQPAPKTNSNIDHDAILDKPSTHPLRLDDAHGRRRYIKISQPTLGQYIKLSKRHVTPIYASYCETIVSLLDLHPYPPTWTEPVNGSSPQKHIEILEAGTGQGGLTMHLARAIAAANSPPPAAPFPTERQSPYLDGTAQPLDDNHARYISYLQSRRAVIHTIENVPIHSTHAENLIRGYRRGMYWPHIDFHTGSVDDWLASRLPAADGPSNESKRPFLTHAILDLPSTEDYLEATCNAMRDGAILVVFTPSITQVGDCLRKIRQLGLPLGLRETVELGEGISTGRQWDLRLVRPRRKTDDKLSTPPIPDQPSDHDSETDVEEHDTDADPAEAEGVVVERTTQPGPEAEPKMVCRPRVGELTMGGGFLGVWEKSPYGSAEADADASRLKHRQQRRHRAIAA